MIQKVIIRNFKSHKNTEIDCSNLTVLCGANGVGKSSIVHVLLLLREAFLNNSNFDYLNLKSKPITVGTAMDALYQFSSDNEISFDITTDRQKLNFSFVTKDADLVKTMLGKSSTAVHCTDRTELEKENLFDKHCQFISAARLGPQGSYLKDDVIVGIQNQISVIEGQAEYFIHFLDKNRNIDILPELCLGSKNDLYTQTTLWEREISEGVNVIVQDLGSLGYELKYQFNTNSEHGKTNEFKAVNVGFGLTYVMPIIVAILSAPRGALLFIENPEAHLHPKGQAKLAELICLAAQAGIQIVMETHSDHIINGILVNCKKFEKESKGISRDNVSMIFFERDETNHSSKVSKILIEEEGTVRYTPKGFFDQFTIDRKYLMGF